MTRLRVWVGVVATVGVLCAAAPSQANPITYAVSAIASGTLGGSAFTNALVTVTLVGDTSAVFQPLPADLPQLFANPGTATVTVAGLGTATLNDPSGYAAVAFPVIPGEIPLPSVGIWEGFDLIASTGTAILGVGDDSLAGYDLKSPLGPLAGAGSGVSTNPDGSPVAFATNVGPLVISRTGENGTLTVTTTTSVPEPVSLSLLGIGGLSLLGAMYRRKRQHL
jgi:hypothetical protein